VRLVVSVDGATAATHEDSRPGADFQQLMSALRAVRDAAAQPGAHPRFRFAVNTVVTRRNLDEVPGILDLAASHGAKAADLIAPGVGGRDDAFAHDAIGRHEALFAARLPAIRDAAAGLGIAVTVPPFIERAGAQDTAGAFIPTQQRPFAQECPDPWRTVYVDVDGWVRPCCRALSIGMGNILDSHFWDIWNGRHYLRLRTALSSNAPPEFCRDCTLPWGITGGDSNYPAKLAQRGIVLPRPPEIGFSWDKRSRTVSET
jgi:MoaA/NifB/PqqE/SkfB family radical SAM enzyme